MATSGGFTAASKAFSCSAFLTCSSGADAMSEASKTAWRASSSSSSRPKKSDEGDAAAWALLPPVGVAAVHTIGS